MARPTVRSSTLLLDDVEQLKSLFGSAANVHRVLGLKDELPYSTIYRALQFHPIKPEERELIQERWHMWREMFLKRDRKYETSFELTQELMEEYDEE